MKPTKAKIIKIDSKKTEVISIPIAKDVIVYQTFEVDLRTGLAPMVRKEEEELEAGVQIKLAS